jgi:CheY-like chemotaxis protein
VGFAIAVPSPKRILVADDQAVNRKLTTHRLQQLGFEVDVVENGLQAIEAVSRATYDFIFMDCHMPHLDGFRAAEWIRQHEHAPRHTPIIAFTASLAESERHRCLAAGMDDIVAKPASDSDLLRVIQRWIPDVDAAPLRIPLDEMMQIYLADAPKRLTEIREALASRNADRLAEAAHALKSGSGSAGAARTFALCDRLETSARAGDLETAAAIVEQLEAGYRE